MFPHYPDYVKACFARLALGGHPAFLVGGCVRDRLMGRVPGDYDMATPATPEQVMALFPRAVPTGLKHGTVTVVLEGGQIEVTTFRTEGGYADGRHPDRVRFVTSLEQDLARRDFTVNAMALGASGRVYGVGVLGSLENGYLEAPRDHENADTYYQFCTAFPVGTALAQTWDTALLEEFGRAIAREMEEFGVDLWLAPGMNIQRNPLCGRNFEYYAEDPLLSGVLAAAVTRGVQHSGRCGVTVKHFACNNQEDNRMGVDVRISQRALREIYLRGFEIAVKTAAPAAIMSSYNRINGVYASNSRDLCTVLAREEWGFDGVIMSDWNTTVPADGSIPWQCAAAGNDIIMPGNPDDDASIRSAYAAGRLSEQDIRVCAGRVIALAARLRGQEKPDQ